MLKLSPDEAALLKAVCADRDNDLPRLVYADYLDDHGRPERAEFVRLQCELALRKGTKADRAPLRWRQNNLLLQHRAVWNRWLPKWAWERHEPDYVRGFVQEVWVTAGYFTRYGPQLLDRTPLRRLMLLEASKLWRDVVRCGWLGEVDELCLYAGDLTVAQVALLASEAAWLSRIGVLELDASDLCDSAARTLASCRHLTGLRLLSLRDNRLTLAGLEALLASPYLISCRFHLAGNPELQSDPHAAGRMLGPRGTF